MSVKSLAASISISSMRSIQNNSNLEESLNFVKKTNKNDSQFLNIPFEN